jgi:hypothetical protein
MSKHWLLPTTPSAQAKVFYFLPISWTSKPHFEGKFHAPSTKYSAFWNRFREWSQIAAAQLFELFFVSVARFEPSFSKKIYRLGGDNERWEHKYQQKVHQIALQDT